MKVKVPDYFKDFKCIASKCEDTCCANWSIVIDEETNDFYQSVTGDFGKILRSKIVKDEDGDDVFILNNGNCSFLNDKKMCDIYTNLGEEHLCYTCKQFPRYTEEFLDYREQGISLSCPEAARVILNKPREIKFDNKEIEVDYEIDDIIEDIIYDFINARDIIFEIIEMENLDLDAKMALIMNFIKEVQNKIDLGDMDEIKHVVSLYQNEAFRYDTIKNLKEKKQRFNRYKKLQEYFEIYKNLKHIYPKNPIGIDTALDFLQDKEEFYLSKSVEFVNYYKEKNYKFKSIFTYFIYRYFMKSLFDYDMSAKVKLAIISTIIMRELSIVRFIENSKFTDQDIVDIAHMYSKDIEHSEENIEKLQEIFETKKEFETDTIIDILIAGV